MAKAKISPSHTDISDADIQARLDHLFNFYPVSIDMSLDRITRLLNDLDNPHLKLPPVVHVAGTNGKGSTIAFLKSILEADGKIVHAFTSPHLVRYNERLCLAGELITNQELADVLSECERVNNGLPITFFEITTVASFLAFSRVKADIILLETGLGGRLDATNVVPHPLCTIITTISNDHSQFLGPTLPLIAGEKAGILKSNRPCILGYQTQQGLDTGVDIVIEQKANELDAPLYKAGEAWHIKQEQDGLLFEGFGEKQILPIPSLLGPHQILNAGSAVAACYILNQNGFEISFDAISDGIGQATWPGRLQRLDALEKRHKADKKTELWLDGGHNDSAGATLATQADLWKNQDSKPLHLVVAMLNTKLPEDFLCTLGPKAASVTFIPVPGDKNSFSPAELKQRVASVDGMPELFVSSSWEQAISDLLENASDSSRILTCGSLYLAGYILGQAQSLK